MTEKLYYQNSHLFEFDAAVVSCIETKSGWAVCLDRTAFFPEGGGQSADTGRIGDADVTDVQIKDGEIIHYCTAALETGKTYHCALNREQRLCRMQNHSGEHIVSGLVHKLYGFENVGFHMGEGSMTIDFSGELSENDLERIETLANQAVRDNLQITTFFPAPDELSEYDYRSKLELTHDVRLVEIEGIDLCACCAPHVSAAGEIGVIKIFDWLRHRGGVRVTLACGMWALEDYRVKQKNIAAISAALSAKRDESAAAVKRVMDEQAILKERVKLLGMESARLRAESIPYRVGNICVFDELLDELALRELVNLLTEKCTGIAAVFFGVGEKGMRYIIGSRHIDLRTASRAINAGIGGKGGGSREMIQGSAAHTREIVQKFIENTSF